MGGAVVNQSKPVEPTQFTEDQLKTTINSLPNLSSSDRDALLKEAAQIYNPKSSNNLEGSNHKTLSERDILNQLRMNNPAIDASTLQGIDERLDTKRQSLQKLGDVKVLVIETSLQDSADPLAHSNIVAAIVADENRSLKPDNIMQVGLREAGGSVEGLRQAAILSKQIQAEGGKPPVVNMSLEVGSMTNLKPDDGSGIGGTSDISPLALGYPKNVTAAEMAKDPVDLRRRLTTLANSGDKQAKQTLAEADAILDLANTGAKVNVAWANKDKVNLVGLITQGHPNVTFIAATDGHNNLSSNLNPTTGNLAETRQNGNVLILPNTLAGQVVPSSADGARVLYLPQSNPKSLAGKDPTPLLISDAQINASATQIKTVKDLGDAYYLNDIAQSAVSATQGSGSLSFELGEQILYHRKGLDAAIQKAGLPPLGEGEEVVTNLTAILKDPLKSKALMQVLREDLAAKTPPGMTTVNEKTMEAMTTAVAKPLEGKLITPQQFEKLFGMPPPKGSLPSDSKQDAPVYVTLTRPNEAIGTYPTPNTVTAYQAVRLKNGSTVLAIPSEGTSYAAPTQSGIDSKR